MIFSSLYILDSSPLSDMCAVNIFSQSMAFLLIFLMVSFVEQTFKILMRSFFKSVLSFMNSAFLCLS